MMDDNEMDYKKMKLILWKSVIASLVFFSGATVCQGSEVEEAFYIEPMEVQIPPAKASTAIRVFNNEQHLLRIRVDVFERTDNADGSERRVLAKDLRPDIQEFDLKPGSSRQVVLSYHGAKKISKERAYRVVVKQVLNSQLLPTTAESLDLRFIYIASVFVTPERARANLVVDSVRRLSDRMVEVELSNLGHAHQKMKQIDAVVVEETAAESGDGSRISRELELSPDSIAMLAKQNLLSGGRRIFRLELNEREDEISRDARLRVKIRANRGARPPASN